MLAAFSRELEGHRAAVRTMLLEHSRHVDEILERLQSVVRENEALRIENEQLLAVVEGRDSDRPSVAIKIVQAGTERPSWARSLLNPATPMAWARLVGMTVGGLLVGAGLVLWRWMVK